MVLLKTSDLPNSAILAGTNELMVSMVTDHMKGEEEMEVPNIADELEFTLKQERLLHDTLPSAEFPETPERYER